MCVANKVIQKAGIVIQEFYVQIEPFIHNCFHIVVRYYNLMVKVIFL